VTNSRRSLPEVVIYTDGACLGNPGRGGYAAILMFGDHRRELSQGFRLTTNNRMELMGPIAGLEALTERCHVHLFSDSEYVVNGITKGWAKNWRKRNWVLSTGKPTVNVDLWSRLLDLCEQHEVELSWVRGHAGDEGNERADQLAVAAANSAELAVDEGYESIPHVKTAASRPAYRRPFKR
jgi:ribonuclease HI